MHCSKTRHKFSFVTNTTPTPSFYGAQRENANMGHLRLHFAALLLLLLQSSQLCSGMCISGYLCAHTCTHMRRYFCLCNLHQILLDQSWLSLQASSQFHERSDCCATAVAAVLVVATLSLFGLCGARCVLLDAVLLYNMMSNTPAPHFRRNSAG